MRRLGLALGVIVALLGATGRADAHPLGNFSVNHLAVVSIARDAVDVRWILDQAEVPTFQERGLAPREVLARKRAAAEAGLALRVDGRAVALRPVGAGRIAFPPGQGGLRLTRVELRFRASAVGARRVELRDSTFRDRIGWRDIIVRPGAGTAVRSSVPAREPTGGLRRYPRDLISSPANRRVARFTVRAGHATVAAPGSRAEGPVTTDRGGGGFARLFDDAAAGRGVLLAFLLAAFGWGALHALSPGHGKAMVAAYLVGTRGTARQAVLLGATVTVTHTIGVFALGLVTLALSDFILPEDLYPWLNLVAGAMVVGVGIAVLRGRLRRAVHAHDHHHHHHHASLTPRGLLALGASAGLIPCPSALVVLLGAIAQAQILLGMVLIVAFSLGLAATLTVLGLAAVWTTGRVERLRVPAAARLLPVASAAVIVALGCALTVQAVPKLV
ncbi:MAG: high-affinity nickel-transporter [Actinobacteria bacterium]|nr:MAG: high-affinity nickel-transporter [Actinomycetota bacterium]